MENLVSVIIPNSGRDLNRIIHAIEDCDYNGGIEIIMVNHNQERSTQRNTGIKTARGEFIFILDSDQVPSKSLITECVSIMKCNDLVQGIYIPEEIVGDTLFLKVLNYERQFYTATPVDVVRFVRANNCPMFDETMSGPEDADWGNRIDGLKLVSKSCLYHYEKVNLFTYLKKKAYYTKSMRKYISKWSDDQVLSFRYRCFWVFLEKSKWKIFLRHPIMSFYVMVIILLRGIIYLCLR